jgi:hypothetical protein
MKLTKKKTQQMATKKITLPKRYTENTWEWMGKPEEFKDFIGMYCVSYSQINGFTNYKKDWIKNYCFGIKEDPGMFANFGIAVGRLFETGGEDVNTDWLKEDTLDALADKLYPKDCEYEKPVYIVIDLDGVKVLIYGFIDVYSEKESYVCDIKTGSIASKTEFYESEDYMQTRLYAYALDKKGVEVKRCFVHLLDRKGNGSTKHPLRLTGEEKIIDTPYTKEVVENWLEDYAKPVLRDVSYFYQTYTKIFT